MPLIEAAKEGMELARDHQHEVAAAMESSHVAYNTWASFHQSLGVLLRGRVPDPHTLLALQASLEKKSGNIQLGTTKGSAETSKPLAAEMEEEDFIALTAGGLPLNGSSKGNDKAATEPVVKEGNEEADLLDLEASLFEDDASQSGDECSITHRTDVVMLCLLKVGSVIIYLYVNAHSLYVYRFSSR